MYAHSELARRVVTGSTPGWQRELLQCAIQSPLLRTRASVAGLLPLRARPRAVMLGIGLGSAHTLSMGLPFDVLGMLLAAACVRHAARAERVVILIADHHALTNGFDPTRVEAAAADVQWRLTKVGSALDLPLEIVRASALQQTNAHRSVLADVRRRGGEAVHPYVQLEVADTEALRRRHGAIVKLGWALDVRRCAPTTPVDERYFDARFREWVGTEVGFAYARPGRTLDPRRPLAAPYVAIDPAARLLLSPRELAGDKLGAFLATAPRAERLALLGHLRRITRVYGRIVAPLAGPVPERVGTILRHIFAEQPRTASQPPGWQPEYLR